MQYYVVVYLDDFGNLQAEPNPLSPDGGDTVSFVFNVGAEVNMEGGKNGVNAGLTDATTLEKAPGGSQSIGIKKDAGGTYTYDIYYPTEASPLLTIRPQMIIKDK